MFDGAGQIFVFVDIDRQPALARSGAVLAARPPAFGDMPAPAGPAVVLPAPHGDVEDGLVPLRRITLAELARFATLDHFFRKQPLAPQAKVQQADDRVPGHEYACVMQEIPNFGAGSIQSIWRPSILPPDQIFSLSQQWCIATGENGRQTVEVGWQVFPQKYGHTFPVLFIFWTPDDYITRSYNGENDDFVQVSPSTAPGLALTTTSVPGGVAAELLCYYALYQGNWWLFIGGTDPAHAVGYYPGSLFDDGPLPAGAQQLVFGGETNAFNRFPPMGSGAPPATGRLHTAFHRNITYLKADPAGSSTNADLHVSLDGRPHYDVALSRDATWGASILFGGAGGPSGGAPMM